MALCESKIEWFLTYIKTSEQKADMLTKALGPEKIWQIMNELKFVKSNPSGSVGDCGLDLGSGQGNQAKRLLAIQVDERQKGKSFFYTFLFNYIR